MSLTLPLPRDTAALIERQIKEPSAVHPGLLLDKYVSSYRPDGKAPDWQKEVQQEALKAVVGASQRPPAGLDWKALQAQRDALWTSLRAETFRCQTIGPLTLHLARASALENAGLALHPLYGFACLPGSGLKGLARAWAETVWLPTQFKAGTDPRTPANAEEEQKATAAWRTLEAVFGWAPGSDRGKSWKPSRIAERPKDESASAGAVVFHDAWPTGWPPLVLDIVNNHHRAYYDEEQPPGDWENPIPVNFLAVAPGTEFLFALSSRRTPPAPDLPALARQWLLGALCHLGAGAKTNAGYGTFRLVDAAAPTRQAESQATTTWSALCKAGRRAECSTTLELVTPAFLAGARQEAADCDLRPATLRGHLRWWWRTLHAGFLDTPTLRTLEATLWGDTTRGGAVRIGVERKGEIRTVPVPGKLIQKDRRNRDVLRLDREFAGLHKLAGTPDQKTTQGLLYLSFGMDEMPADRPDERKQRHCILPPAGWNVTLSARDGIFDPPDAESARKPVRLSADLVLKQARAALWLLCRYGGIGSKGRNGFGSFADLPDYTLDEVKDLAAKFRSACGIRDQRPGCGECPHLDGALPPEQISVHWKNYWFVLDQLGFSLQAFAKEHKRKWIKEALGLPRKIGRSANDGTRDHGYTAVWDDKARQEVVWLGQFHPHRGGRDPQEMRHSAPVHLHVGREGDGAFVIRVLAFPSAILPDLETSRGILQNLLDHLRHDFDRRKEQNPSPGQPADGGTPHAAHRRGPRPHPERMTAVSVPPITVEQLRQKLNEVQTTECLLKVAGPPAASSYQCQLYKPASKVSAGYQTEGGWRLEAAPQGLPEGTIILAERIGHGKAGRFVEIIGKLPPKGGASERKPRSGR